MQDNNERETNNKVSMTVSVFIALCVVSIFCVVSIVIVENIDSLSSSNKSKRIHLPHHRDFTDFLIL
jgi:hypothetical protein